MLNMAKLALLRPIAKIVISIVLILFAAAVEAWLSTPKWFGAVLLILLGLFLICATEQSKKAVVYLFLFWAGWRFAC